MSKNIFSAVLILFLVNNILENSVWAQSGYVTLSQVKTRAVAMGGAYSAVGDNLAACIYNPATFEEYEFPKDFRITFYLNPFAPLVSLYGKQSEKAASESNQVKYSHAAGLLVKGITGTFRNFLVGIVFNEESVANRLLNYRKQFFAAESHWQDYSHIVTLRLKLAPQVALGVSTSFYSIDSAAGKSWYVDTSYGVLLRPDEKLNVGVFYVALPEGLENHRQLVERLSNDSINIGLAYYPRKSTIISLDLRNINDEGDDNAIQPHVGIEQKFQPWLALRGGFYRQKNGALTFSTGVGIISNEIFHKKKNRFKNNQFMINYTYLVQSKNSIKTNWHFFSFNVRI